MSIRSRSVVLALLVASCTTQRPAQQVEEDAEAPPQGGARAADASTGGRGGGSGSADAALAGDARAQGDAPRDTSAAGFDAPLPPDPGGIPAVVTNRYDNLRTGANTRETVLNASNVTADGFGLLFSRPYDGNPYGQPLYVPGVTVQGKKRNLVIVATSTNHVYAFDGDDPAAMMPVWGRQVAPPADIQVSSRRGVPGLVWCGDMYPFTGVTSTPVIDLAAGRIYLVSKSGKVGGPYVNRLHALDLLTGQEAAGSPIEIQASAPGTGAGAVEGKINFDGWTQMARPGLLLHQGLLYIAFGSHCDINPYHGWVLAYEPATLKQRHVFNTTPNGQKGAIWQSGGGLAANANGIFFATGNGSFAADGSALSMSVVKLKPDLTLADWFTPANAKRLDEIDKDLASGVLLIPETNLAVAAGKEGTVYVVDQTNMTHHDPTGDKIVQTFKPGGEIRNHVFWNNRVYIWPYDNGLRVYGVANGKLSNATVARFDGARIHQSGAVMTISSNGVAPGSGILWVSYPTGPRSETPTGGLMALDAVALDKKLWDSTTNAMRDDAGLHAKWSPPTVANGKVYLSTFAPRNASSPAYLRVYGLLPGR